MAYIGKVPTAVPLSGADLEDNIITSAKIVDGTIATADISDGAVTSVKTTGVGGTNTPAFHVSLSAIQQTTDLATTKVQFDTESFDTDNCFDNSTNYRFTPTVAGKYFIYTSLSCRSNITNQLVNLRTYIYKNGSELIKSIGTDFRTNNGYQTLNYTGAMIEMNGSTDYIEFFARVDHQGGTNGGVDAGSYAGAYKIIE